MLLFYKDQLLGAIQNSSATDFPWMTGNLIPTDDFYKFQRFFQTLVDEDAGVELDSFDAAWLEEGNWQIEENEARKYIFPPAIPTDMTIEWRWNN